MEKIYKKILLGGIWAILFAFSSCSSDYLNTSPTGSVGTSSVFATTKNAAMAINGIAQVMCNQQYSFSQGCSGENRIKSIYGEYPSYEFIYNQSASGWAVIMNGLYYAQTSSSYSAYPWYYYYTIIGNTNTIIAHVDEAEGLEADRKFIKAQAYAFRAYAYTQLLQIYSYRWSDSNNGATSGVVLRLDESTGDMPLSTLAECYQQIYSDCQSSISLFTESGEDRTSGSVWLPNINVAYAVYARAALNRQDYQTALTNAKLARNGYALMSNSDYTSGFCKPTSEWILGSYGDATENQWYWSFGTQFACNGYYATNTRYGAGAINTELTDSIPNNDIRKSLFFTKDKFPDYDLTKSTNMNQTYAYFVNTSLINEAEEYADSKTPSGLASPYQAGYYYLGGQLKFWVFDTPGVSYLCHIRSSEMVLIEAEANYFLNNTSAAQASLVELNASTGRNATYTCTKTGINLFNEIVKYRTLELWGEGFSWFDYKRWGLDFTRLGISAGGNAHAAIAVTVKAQDTGHSKWTWGIPVAETDYNDAISQ